MNHDQHNLFSVAGITGTVATISLVEINAWLSLGCGLCTLVIVAPKAWSVLRALKTKKVSSP